jgi:tetratricopeptide (TPR) repeat protein
MKGDKNRSAGKLSRRQFLVGTGAIGAAMLLPGRLLAIPNTIPDSQGFLVVDLKKCQGCGTCMMACALAHSGMASYSLSRIQIQQDSFVDWLLESYEEAIAAYKKAISIEPGNLVAHVALATVYALDGREMEAQGEAEEVLRIEPKFSVERYAKSLAFMNQAYRDLSIAALRKAGLK